MLGDSLAGEGWYEKEWRKKPAVKHETASMKKNRNGTFSGRASNQR